MDDVALLGVFDAIIFYMPKIIENVVYIIKCTGGKEIFERKYFNLGNGKDVIGIYGREKRVFTYT